MSNSKPVLRDTGFLVGLAVKTALMVVLITTMWLIHP